jgi:transposase-like protein
MSSPTISTFQLFSLFPDEAAARAYLEARHWPAGVCCPTCSSTERITTRGGKRAGFYRCGSGCGEFTVRTGTIFERSHLTLRQWVLSMYMLVTARKGISSLKLSKEIGCTQRSAWFALHRLREACGGEFSKLAGELDRLTDAVFAHKPRPKSEAAKGRQKIAKLSKK